MDTETTVSISFVFAVLGTIATIMGIVGKYKNNKEKETSEKLDTTTQFTRINVKIDTMSDIIMELIHKNEKCIEDIEQIKKNLVLANERIENLLKENGEHSKRIKEIEGLMRGINDERY